MVESNQTFGRIFSSQEGGTVIDVRRFDHVAIAVRDLARAAELYGDVLGGELVRGGDDLELGIRTMQFKLPPGVKVELLTPIGDSYLARYLDKHGEGFHHATIFVADIHAAVAELGEWGFEVVDFDPAMPTWQEVFVRPSSGFGALLQVVATTSDWSRPTEGITREAILAGEWRWMNNDCVPAADVEDQSLTSTRPPKNFARTTRGG
jgi:methylmalonyl-CoA/ethylmalonyl-CoA epimerase